MATVQNYVASFARWMFLGASKVSAATSSITGSVWRNFYELGERLEPSYIVIDFEAPMTPDANYTEVSQ